MQCMVCMILVPFWSPTGTIESMGTTHPSDGFRVNGKTVLTGDT